MKKANGQTHDCLKSAEKNKVENAHCKVEKCLQPSCNMFLSEFLHHFSTRISS